MAIEYTYDGDEYRIQIDSIIIHPSRKEVHMGASVINKTTFDMRQVGYSADTENGEFARLDKIMGNSSKPLGRHLVEEAYKWMIAVTTGSYQADDPDNPDRKIKKEYQAVDEIINRGQPPSNYRRPDLRFTSS